MAKSNLLLLGSYMVKKKFYFGHNSEIFGLKKIYSDSPKLEIIEVCEVNKKTQNNKNWQLKNRVKIDFRVKMNRILIVSASFKGIVSNKKKQKQIMTELWQWFFCHRSRFDLSTTIPNGPLLIQKSNISVGHFFFNLVQHPGDLCRMV